MVYFVIVAVIYTVSYRRYVSLQQLEMCKLCSKDRQRSVSHDANIDNKRRQMKLFDPAENQYQINEFFNIQTTQRWFTKPLRVYSVVSNLSRCPFEIRIHVYTHTYMNIQINASKILRLVSQFLKLFESSLFFGFVINTRCSHNRAFVTRYKLT